MAMTVNLTSRRDTFSTSTAGTIFNALPSTSDGSQINTLNAGDFLTDTAGDGVLNFTAVDGLGNPPFAHNVSMIGIQTVNITNEAATWGRGVAGFQGDVVGLTTVNDNKSLATVQLGGMGQGLATPLTNVNINGYAGTNGDTIFTAFIATAVGSASNTINVSIAGAVGDRALGHADKLTFMTDRGMGTINSPNLSYGTWSITADSPSYLQLQQGGVGGVTSLKLSGAGFFILGADAPAAWQNLTTIDASGSIGGVTILGAASYLGTTLPVAFDLNPGGLFGSAAGLLTGNTSLTKFIGSPTGPNILDVSNFTTESQLASLTAIGNNVVTNQILVSSALADTTSPTTWAWDHWFSNGQCCGSLRHHQHGKFASFNSHD